MTEKKNIFRGVCLNYLHLLSGIISLLVLTPIMLRFLGPAAYGVWAVFSSILGYMMLLNFGMSTAVAKYTAEYIATDRKEDLNRIVSSTMAVFILISVALLLAAFSLIPWIPKFFNIPLYLTNAGKITFFLVAVNVAILLLAGVLGNVIYGYHRVDIWKAIAIVQLISNMILTILFLFWGWGVVGVGLAYVISAIILFVLYAIFLKKSGYNLSISLRNANLETLKKIAPYSLRTFILGLTTKVLYYTDNIVISVFLGVASVTPYSIAYRICFFSTYLFSVISSTMFPKFSQLYALKKIDELKLLYVRIAKISMVIMITIAISLWFLGKSFICLWVGKESFVGMHVFSVFICMGFLHAIGTPAGILLQGIGKNKKFVYSELINAFLNLFLSIVLVQKIGVFGVAVGTLFAHLLTSAWFIPLSACRKIDLSFRKYLLEAILPPIIVGTIFVFIGGIGINLLLPNNNFIYLIIKGAIFALGYIGLYLLFATTKEERTMYKDFFKRG